MANILNVQTVGGVWIVNTDTNPTLTGGVDAPIGSISITSDGSGTFTKIGAANTDWILSSSDNQNVKDIILPLYNILPTDYVLNCLVNSTITLPKINTLGVGIGKTYKIFIDPLKTVVCNSDVSDNIFGSQKLIFPSGANGGSYTLRALTTSKWGIGD